MSLFTRTPAQPQQALLPLHSPSPTISQEKPKENPAVVDVSIAQMDPETKRKRSMFGSISPVLYTRSWSFPPLITAHHVISSILARSLPYFHVSNFHFFSFHFLLQLILLNPAYFQITHKTNHKLKTGKPCEFLIVISAILVICVLIAIICVVVKGQELKDSSSGGVYVNPQVHA